jgi:hypothetical protein
MGDEPLAEARLFVQDTDHLGFSDPHHFAFGHGSGRRQAKWLSDQASLPDELAHAQDGGDRFVTLPGRDHELDPARLNVEYRVRCSAALSCKKMMSSLRCWKRSGRGGKFGLRIAHKIWRTAGT